MLSLIGMPAATAQSDAQSTGDEQTNVRRPLEQITIVGQRSLRRLRMQIENKQDEIFAFFNANNSSDRFDILCETRRLTGTHIRSRECEPRFLKDLRVDRTRQFRMGFNTNPGHRELVELAAEDYDRLQQEMARLIQAHPAFATHMAELAVLQQGLEAAQDEE